MIFQASKQIIYFGSSWFLLETFVTLLPEIGCFQSLSKNLFWQYFCFENIVWALANSGEGQTGNTFYQSEYE